MSEGQTNRRDFLKRFARRAGYSVPLVRTLAAPEGLWAQAAASQKMGGMGMGMGMGMLVVPRSFGDEASGVGPPAPWWADPPGGGS